MKLRKKLMLLEEFDTQSNAKVNTEVKAEVKTETKTGEAIRTEVIADVDAILTNLETLSAQITEEVDSLLENTNWGEEDALNENFMEDMIKHFKSMKAFAVLNGSWKSLYNKKLKTELAGIDKESAEVLKSEEKKKKILDTIKQKFDKKVESIRANKALPAEKRSQAVKQLRQQQDEQMKEGGPIASKINKKLEAQKAQLKAKNATELRDAGAKVTELESNNPIESELLKKEWAATKQKIQDAADYKHIMDKFEIQDKYDDSDDPERAKKMAEKNKEMLKQQADEAKKKDAERQADLKAAIEDADKRAQEGDDKTKAANEKLSAYYKASSALIGAMDSVKAEDYDDARKLEIKKLKKTQSEAEGKLSGTTFVDGGVAADKEEGETILKDMKANVDESLKDFNALIDDFGDQKTETEEAIDAAKEIEDDKKGDLDLLGDDAAEDEIKAAQKAYFEAQIATQQARKADAAAEGEDETKFDTKITELQGKIAALNSGGSNEAKTAEQVATEDLGDEKESYEKITNPEEQTEEVTDDAGNVITPARDMWKDIKRYKGKDADGNDTAEEVIYAKRNDNSSAATVSGTDINEGISPKIKKAIKAVEKGETVYGENIRFPGRFKILSFNKAGNMATVDYEDGTDAFDMAAMNIAIDKLQFESVETEDVNEAVNASGYIKAGKLGYNDQFLGRQSLSMTLSLDLGFNKKDQYGGGNFIGFDYVSMYGTGKEGTILDDALTGKYTYDELKAAAAEHFGIKEAEEVEEVEEGNQFGAARAEAIAKGEKTFKVGDEEYPVEDVSKEDEENAEEFVEEAKELPKTIKLDEGLTIAQKFARLM